MRSIVVNELVNLRRSKKHNKPRHATASSRFVEMTSRNYNPMAPAKALKDGDDARLPNP
jgi:hypothetical protein